MTEAFDVLVAAGQLLAREGLRRILDTVDDVRVAGEAVTIEEVCLQVRRLCPQVVLLDLKWGRDQRIGLATLTQLKRENPKTKVIAISEFDELVARARGVGADGALDKTFTRDQLLGAIRGVCSGQTGKEVWAVRLQRDAEDYTRQLKTLRSGQNDARRYEALMAEIVPFLFEGHLDYFDFQWPHHQGEDIWDGVAFIKSNHPFWMMIRQQHGTSQVVFEFKNVEQLEKEHILQVIGYLREPWLHFCVITTRNPPAKDAFRKTYRELTASPSSVILIFDDSEILDMLRVRALGEDPSEGLPKKYMYLTRAG